jgi:hypothetical protein
MAFLNSGELLPALLSGAREQFSKATVASQIAGLYCSLWLSAGYPTVGATPGAAAVCSDATTGAHKLPARTGGQDRVIGHSFMNFTLAGNTLIFEDRMAHMGGLNGTLTTAQTVSLDASVTTSNLVERRGASDYSELKWYLEWYTATGATGVNATVAVTYVDDTTSNIVIALPATVAASRRYEIQPTNGKFIKSVQSVTLSATTGTAGSFGVTVCRPIVHIITDVNNKGLNFDWAQLGAREVYDNSCLTTSVLCNATATGAILGNIIMAVK